MTKQSTLEGWQLVPVEPDEAMLMAAYTATESGEVWDNIHNGLAVAYRAMLRASPAHAGEAKSSGGMENCVALSGTNQMNPRSSTDVVLEFARWAIRESCWDGCDLDGGSVQEKAEALGLIAAEPYDIDKHGPCEYCPEPGDDWYVFAGPLAASIEPQRGVGEEMIPAELASRIK
jgi:hypothetical protein